jgi:isopenicillin N synthase-like dioxygenase
VTNGLWYSVPHRVRHEKPGYRYGVVMFNNPHAESIIAPLDEFALNNLDETHGHKLLTIVYKDFHRYRLNELKY